MKDQIIEILSNELDKNLVKDLVESYEDLKSSFIRSDYEGSQSKSGKFVENVFRILHYIRTKEVLPEIKQKKIDEIKLKLLNENSKKYPESIRILIPEFANSLIYLPRSKLGSVHVKPTKPDYIDSKLIIGACDWIMAELLRLFHTRDTESIDNLLKNVVKDNIAVIQKVGNESFLDAKTDAGNEILIRLFDANEGLSRKDLGRIMKQNFSPATITLALKKLKTDRKVFLTSNSKFILADSQREKISNLISELSKNR